MWPTKQPKTLPLPPKDFRMPEPKSFAQQCKEDIDDMMSQGFSREEAIQLMVALIQTRNRVGGVIYGQVDHAHV